ncbi:MAG: subclass B1 metallo-beta-lactamase [Planctomycetota bacterium]
MKYFRLIVVVSFLVFFIGCTNHIESNMPAIKLSSDVEVFQLVEGIWLHTTYYKLPHLGRYPANGIIVISDNNSLMIDLPWKNKQTEILFDWIEKEHKATVKAVVPTHSHTDCAGGLAEAHKRDADSWAFCETIEKMEKEKRTVPKNGFAKTERLECGDIIVELAYLGGGHTTDNIVAWIPSQKVLFSGCLVKSLDAKNLGNTKEADLANYPKTLKTALQKYADAKVIMPGHGKPGNLQLIKHTIELCNNKN